MRLSGPIWDTPSGKQIATPGFKKMIGYAVADGAEIWRVDGMPSACCTTPVTGDGKLFFAGWSPGDPSDKEFKFPQFDDLLKEGDTNKDGKLTKAEWVVNNNPNEEKSFNARDLNHDGVVTRDEALAYGRNKGVAKKLMDAADTNRDGWLSPEELQAFHGSMM